MAKKKIIICNNCGAKMDKSLERCPHCGAMNYFGAEQKYMDRLEDIREDLHELKDVAEIKRQKLMKLTLAVSIAVILLFVVPYAVLAFRKGHSADASERSYEEAYVERLAWEDKYFPLMDAAYEEGDLARIAQIYEEHSAEEGAIAYYQWTHYYLMDYYNMYEKVLYFKNETEPSVYWLSYAVELAGYWTGERLEAEQQNAYYGHANLTEQDIAYVKGFQKEAWELFAELGLSEQEVLEIAKQSTDDDYFSYSVCEQLLEERLQK